MKSQFLLRIFSIMVLSFIFIFNMSGCGKKSNSKYQKQSSAAAGSASVRIFIKWPEKTSKQNSRFTSRIPYVTQSIKISITGTYLKNPQIVIINRTQELIKETELKIPVGLTSFQVTAYDKQNADGEKIAIGELTYNVLSDIVNEIKIALEGVPKYINITPQQAIIKIGDTCQFLANIYDVDNFILPGDKIQWGIEDINIAILDKNGKATGILEGNTNIIVSIDDISAKAQLEVVELESVSDISAIGGNQQITLNWTKARGAKTYSIYYSNLPYTSLNEKTFLINTIDTTYIHTELENGKDYFYVVISKNGDLVVDSSPEAAASPTDSFLYLTCADSNCVEGFAINKNSGNLTKLGEIFTSVKSDYKIDKNIAISLSKNMLYVSSYDSNKIYQYYIDSISGNLTLNEEITTGNNPRDIKIDPAEEKLYTANYNDNSLYCYNIGADGRLTLEQNIEAENGPNSICINPLNSFLYLANYRTPYFISHYEIANESLIFNEKIEDEDRNITSILFSPDGNSIYAAGQNDITRYSIDETGKLEKTNFLAYQGTISSLSFTKNGKFLYASNYSSDYITSYLVDDYSGNLAQNEIVKCGDGPQDILINEDFLYITNSLEDTLSIYKIDLSYGKLNLVNKVNTAKKPVGISIYAPVQNAVIKIGIE